MGWASVLISLALAYLGFRDSSEGGNDSGITCRWLLISACSPLAFALSFVTMWLRTVLKELKDEQTGRLNDLKDQFKSIKPN